MSDEVYQVHRHIYILLYRTVVPWKTHCFVEAIRGTGMIDNRSNAGCGVASKRISISCHVVYRSNCIYLHHLNCTILSHLVLRLQQKMATWTLNVGTWISQLQDFFHHIFSPIFSRSRKLRRFPDPISFFLVVISQRLEKHKQIASYKLMQVGYFSPRIGVKLNRIWNHFETITGGL